MPRSSLFELFVVVCLVSSINTQQCDQTSDNARFDCYPDPNPTQSQCEARNCCWNPMNRKSDDIEVGVPFCYYPKDFPAYQVITNQSTDFGQRLRIIKQQKTYMPNDILDLTVDLIYETQQRLRIRIYDTLAKRYEVPLDVPSVQNKANMTDYVVTVQNSPFAIMVKRQSTGMVLFDSSVSPLIYADQFIKFSTRLSSPFVYGLGEHKQPLLLNLTSDWQRLTFWTRDVGPQPDTNLYGVHPFHLNIEQNADQQISFHGQFLLNSNAMDIDLQPLPALTYTTIGGIIDLYLFTGPTAHDVIEQYWDVIGKPMLPPFWSLGFHLCRWGYGTIENLIAVIQRMQDADFPVDVQWTDIDTMKSHLDFTYDDKTFHGLSDLVRNLQANGMHYVNIIDPGISSTQPAGSYPPYDEGLRRRIFITKYNSTDPLLGTVWPGTTAFPDFTNPESIEWWTNSAGSYHDIVPFDGMWIDMNEPSSFIDGSIDGCTLNSLDNPPYTPHVLGGNLTSKTICTSGQQYLSSHYNLHSMYGFFEAKASNIAMRTIRQKRPFVLTRSSFAGSGQFTAHWTGDNGASYEDLYSSIPTILSFNMFGITHVGADICGFGGDTTEELCTRWMQLGAFYPFMRNHNTIGAKDQDPAAFSWEAQQIMKQALMIRYSLIPFWYTLHYQATTQSKAILQPLLFEYSNDRNTFNIDQQFLLGRAILVSPNLVKNATTVHAYFPSDTWYEFPSGVKLSSSGGEFIDLSAPLSKINLHLRGGFIIPMQTPGPNLILGRTNPFMLLVASSKDGTANGTLYWDDGDSIDPIGTKNYNLFQFDLSSSNILTINAVQNGYKDALMILDIVKVLGVDKTVISVSVNGQTYTNFIYNSFDKILLIYGLNSNMLSQTSQTIRWVTSS